MFLNGWWSLRGDDVAGEGEAPFAVGGLGAAGGENAALGIEGDGPGVVVAFGAGEGFRRCFGDLRAAVVQHGEPEDVTIAAGGVERAVDRDFALSDGHARAHDG